MIIENLRSEHQHDRARIAATVRWEDSDRPTQEIYFETTEEFAGDLMCNPHAFLVGCVIPAFHHGEKRVLIDEGICPELREGLVTVMSWIRHWHYEPDKQLVRIDAKTHTKILTPNKSERAGSFVSGGVDGLAAIRCNRLQYPLEHPGSFKDALVVFGLHREEPEDFRQVLSSVSEVAKEQGLNLIPVHTNIVSLGNGWEFWVKELFAGAFASIAHAFTRRLSVVSLASTGRDIPHLFPHGSHPLIEPNYRSSDLRIRHEGVRLSRLEKVRILVGWDLALKHLQVCNNTRAIRMGRLNCGRCEKCIRTMLEFLALGSLDNNPAFEANDVSSAWIKSSVTIDPIDAFFYEELLGPLTKQGRIDLVTAIKDKLSEHYRVEAMRRLREGARRLDRRYLGGGFARVKKKLLGTKSSHQGPDMDNRNTIVAQLRENHDFCAKTSVPQIVISV